MSDTKETKKTTELSKVLDFDSKDAVKFERTSGTKVPSGKSTPIGWLESWFKLNEVEYRFDGNHLIKDESKSSGTRRVNSESLYNYIFVGTGLSGGKDGGRALARAGQRPHSLPPHSRPPTSGCEDSRLFAGRGRQPLR